MNRFWIMEGVLHLLENSHQRVRRSFSLRKVSNAIRLKKTMDITPEILKLCAKDDRKAINGLYEHCFHHLMPVCFRYNNNEEDARASYNNGFIKILAALKKVDREKVNFHAWSKRIMVNALIDEYRKHKKYNTRIFKSDDERELDYYAEGYENDAESNLGYEMIMRMVRELPMATGKVFNLFVVEGYSHKEIGELLEMSEGTSKWHLSTARKLLRSKLNTLENWNRRMVI